MIELKDFLNNELTKFYSNSSDKKMNNNGRKDIVAFIGAGISGNYGCSSWHKLACDLIDECKNYEMDFLTAELLKKEQQDKILITIAHNYLNRKQVKHIFIDKIKKALNYKEDSNAQGGWSPIDIKKTSEIYNHIKFIFNSYITTNADRHIDILGSHINFEDFNKIASQKDGELSWKSLYKIHGCISKPDSMIFTSDSYIKAYSGDGKLGSFLTTVFERNITVFIGYGLAEFEILERMLTSHKAHSSFSVFNHFIIRGYYRHEKYLIDAYDLYFHSLGVEQVVFFKDQNGYDELNTQIKQCYDRLKAMDKPLQKYSEIDSIMKEI